MCKTQLLFLSKFKMYFSFIYSVYNSNYYYLLILCAGNGPFENWFSSILAKYCFVIFEFAAHALEVRDATTVAVFAECCPLVGQALHSELTAARHFVFFCTAHKKALSTRSPYPLGLFIWKLL